MQTEHTSSYKTVVKAPVTTVWEALTDPALVKQYFFGSDLLTNWKPGSQLIWRGEYEGQVYEDKGEVLEFHPNERLAFSYLSSWSGKEDLPENYLLVTYSLRAIPEGTELTITQSNYDAEKAAHSAENWNQVIDGLKQIVEG